MDLDLKYYTLLARCVGDARDDAFLDALADAYLKGGPEETVFLRKVVCTVDDAWVNEAEAGLSEIAVCIAENRSFLKNEGRVVPIERVRRVSKESIFHLAKHSELITDVDEQGKAQPDRLHVTENLDDYAVYENRFLYLALKTVQAFIAERLKEMRDLEAGRTTSARMSKEVGVPGKRARLTFTLEDRLDGHGSFTPAALKAQTLYGRAETLLRTDLMRKMADAPALFPPITRTNVLKTNRHFRAVLSLYEYLTSYEGNGCRYEEKCEELPVGEESARALAAASALLISAASVCDPAYRAALESRRRAELARLFAEGRDGEDDPVGRILAAFERRELTLEEASAAVGALMRAESARRDDEARALKNEKEDLTAAVLKARQEEAGANARADSLKKEMTGLRAQLDALRCEYGRIDPADLSYTEKERFDELEREKRFLDKLVNVQWKKTKKQIRKRVFAKEKPDGAPGAGKSPDGAPGAEEARKPAPKNENE